MPVNYIYPAVMAGGISIHFIQFFPGVIHFVEKILNDLSQKFRKNLDEIKQKELLENIDGEYFKNIQSVVDSSAGAKTTKDLVEFFDNNGYKDLKIELLPLLQPFENAFFKLLNW